jgi:hypothetical protein
MRKIMNKLANWIKQHQVLVFFIIAILVLILIDRMWKNFPSDHPAVYTSHPLAIQLSVEPARIPGH